MNYRRTDARTLTHLTNQNTVHIFGIYTAFITAAVKIGFVFKMGSSWIYISFVYQTLDNILIGFTYVFLFAFQTLYDILIYIYMYMQHHIYMQLGHRFSRISALSVFGYVNFIAYTTLYSHRQNEETSENNTNCYKPAGISVHILSIGIYVGVQCFLDIKTVKCRKRQRNKTRYKTLDSTDIFDRNNILLTNNEKYIWKWTFIPWMHEWNILIPHLDPYLTVVERTMESILWLVWFYKFSIVI